ncbi:MAG: hypothetical protein WC709_11835 [Thermoleophilia bacterium]
MKRRSGDRIGMAASKAQERTLPGETPVWDQADDARWGDPQRRARLRRRVLYGALVGVLAAEIVGAFVWIAASHYDRGRQALAAGIYSTAIDEFSAARILVVPYRDANELRSEAEEALAADEARQRAARARDAALAVLLREADALVAAGDAADALTRLREARARVPEGPLGEAAATRALADGLAHRLAEAARAALAAAHWLEAERYAASLLLLSPSSDVGSKLAREARLGKALQAKLAIAGREAGRGHWRRCLVLALAVVKQRPDFPGASRLVARARAALAPKPAPATPAPAVTSTPAPPAPPQPPPP